MSRIVDNLLAFKVLKLLTTNFEDTPAYKEGIIDSKGKNLRKATTLKTTAEKDAYTYLHRLVFNMKKIINKLPGGESKTKSMIAALFLVKEHYQQGSRVTSTTILSEKFDKVMSVLNTGAVLVEEQIAVRKFYESLEEEAPANSGGTGIALGGEAGANKGTVAGMDMPLKTGKLVKRKKEIEPLKSFAQMR
jgi:hypothetical protein